MAEQKDNNAMISLHHINKYYTMGENQLHVLRDVNLAIEQGDFVSIMGPSGSGKSTLINVLGFLDNEFEGEYRFEGTPIEERRDKEISQLRNKMVGFIFQEFNLIDSMTVMQNVQLPLLYAGASAREARPRVQAALERVGLADRSRNYPHALSGGQRQRVAIARALVNNPKFIIADEPTGALDTKTSDTIMSMLAELHQEGATIVMVTHDPTLQRYATKHIVIIDGHVQQVAADEATALIQSYRMQVGEEGLDAI